MILGAEDLGDLVNRTVLALAGGVVGIIGAMLIGVSGSPPFAGDTTVYEFFGYFSLFCAGAHHARHRLGVARRRELVAAVLRARPRVVHQLGLGFRGLVPVRRSFRRA